MNQRQSEDISECRCEFDGRKYNSRQKWNSDKCQCEYKKPIKHRSLEKDFVWNPSTCTREFKIGEYLNDCEYMKSLVNDLVVTCGEIDRFYLKRRLAFPCLLSYYYGN